MDYEISPYIHDDYSVEPVGIDTSLFSTPLTQDEEVKYNDWARGMGKDPALEEEDYDLPGAWKAGAAQGDNGHLPDTFKKPNHPTFSEDSQYHGSRLGLDWEEKAQGGRWEKDGEQMTFTPGDTNLKMHGTKALMDYFKKYEPDVKLILPGH